MHDSGVRDRAALRGPPFPHEIVHDFTQCRRPDAECMCRVRHVGVGMTMQEQEHAGYGWNQQLRHAVTLLHTALLSLWIVLWTINR